MDWIDRLTEYFRQLPKQPEQSLAPLVKAETQRVDPQNFVVNVVVINVNTDNSNNYGTRVEGSVLVRGNMSASLNTINSLDGSAENNDLKERLEVLHKLMTELTGKLPSEKADRVSRDLRSFVDEASSSEPRTQSLEVTGGGLIEAAKTVAEMAGPIAAAVKAVLALLIPGTVF
jgi:hypothetical protein